jgi:pilus assembly protein Flp/PilA
MVAVKRGAWWARVRVSDGRGASLVEYALLIGLIALVVIVGAILLGDALVTSFSDVGSEVQNAP